MSGVYCVCVCVCVCGRKEILLKEKMASHQCRCPDIRAHSCQGRRRVKAEGMKRGCICSLWWLSNRGGRGQFLHTSKHIDHRSTQTPSLLPFHRMYGYMLQCSYILSRNKGERDDGNNFLMRRLPERFHCEQSAQGCLYIRIFL